MKNMQAILFFLLSFSTSIIAQQTIKGRVVSAATGAPIPGSSVFISNSSKGTTTDNSGQFELSNVPPGKHDLIISYVGYETNVYSFTNDQLPLRLKVEMAERIKEMENVTLEPFVEEDWDKWGKTFTDYFIGGTENAALCKIRNGKAISFRYYKKSNRLKAYSDEPVMIENKALGYTIHYQLEDFEINFKDRSFLYAGYTLFEEMKDARKALKTRWEARRETAYYGSIKHFMKSLFNNKLLQNGFEVRRAVRIPNTEKERVKAIQTNDFKSQQAAGMTITINDPFARLHRDTVAYYREVMEQSDYKEIIGKELVTADSLVLKSQGDYKAIYFTDYLFIIYKNELEEYGFTRVFYPARKSGVQQSYINLRGDDFITIDKNGSYYSPKNLYTTVYWAWSEKMANMLPVDYEIEMEK
jgi:CarboxypepD_reg-like domain